MMKLSGLTKSGEPLHIVRGRYPTTLEGPLGVSGICAADPYWPLCCTYEMYSRLGTGV